jgi:hypothetical protein
VTYAAWLLALMLYREARGESHEAKIAVAHTVLNRVKRPGWWGRDVESVIAKKWQYSSMTDPKDPQLTVWPSSKDPAFIECVNVATLVLEGIYNSPLKGVDSYYDDSLQGDARPKWAKEHPERFVGKIGRLNFYNLDRDV